MKQIIMITGASRGIGKAIALRFANKNTRLALFCHTNEEALKDTCRCCEEKGSECLCFTGDIGDYDWVRTCISSILEKWGTVHVLINNAGISYLGLLTDMTPAQWNEMLTTNLTSLYHTCHEIVPAMVRQQSGCIINISSVWGNIGASCEVAYSAAKGGVNSFTRALAKELAPSNIRVNAISLGAMDTSMNAWLSEEERTALTEEIPCGRFGTPEEAADLVYSISTASSYLTGQIIALDGGWS